VIKRYIFLFLVATATIFAMTVDEIKVASEKEIGCIKGIGKKRLQAIVEFRANNEIEKLEDLLKITGIGNKILSNIKDNILKKSCMVNKKREMIKDKMLRDRKAIKAE
jgi:competence ComEA-like helix-hairpin-helix protein